MTPERSDGALDGHGKGEQTESRAASAGVIRQEMPVSRPTMASPRGTGSWSRRENLSHVASKPEWFREAGDYRISLLVKERARIDKLIAETVKLERQAGRSWAEIAGWLKVSRQAVWERYRWVDDRATEARARRPD